MNINDNPTHVTWKGMVNRCTNPNAKGYERYGGRGIEVCSRWLLSYKHFVDDMGDRPNGMQIDRIDVNGNYEPGNCRWVTLIQNSRNRRNHVYVICNGTRTVMSEAAERCGHNYNSLTAFIYRNKNFAGDVSELRFVSQKKLTTDQAGEIKRSELSARKAAAKFGVSRACVRAIRRGLTWKQA